MSHSFFICTIDTCVNYLTGSLSQLKQAIKASKYITNTVIEVDFTENSLNSQNKIIQSKYQHKITITNTDINKHANNGSFFSC